MNEVHLGTDQFGVQHYIVPNDKHQPASPDCLPIYTIYGRNTSDYPGQHVLRRQVTYAGRVDTDRDPIAVTQTIEEAREKLPPGLTRLERATDDDPTILETWL